MVLKEDFGIYPSMVSLSACFCEALSEQGIDGLCFCGILPEGSATLDYCNGCDDDGCGGMAWVRLTGANTYGNQFPSPDAQSGNCRSPIAYLLEIGFAHCAPMPDSNGTPPSLESQLQATRIQTAAAAAMRRAIQCCFGNSDRQYQMGAYTPVETRGDCLAATWAVTVGDA